MADRVLRGNPDLMDDIAYDVLHEVVGRLSQQTDDTKLCYVLGFIAGGFAKYKSRYHEKGMRPDVAVLAGTLDGAVSFKTAMDRFYRPSGED